MNKSDVQALDRDQRIKMSHGTRKHYKGKMVQPSGGPRSHSHGGHSRSRVGWTQGDQAMVGNDTSWKMTPGKYKVQLDARLTKFRGRATVIGQEAA